MAQIELALAIQVPTSEEIVAAFRRWAGARHINQELVRNEFAPILARMIKVTYQDKE